MQATKYNFQDDVLPIDVCCQNFYRCAQLQKLDICFDESLTKDMSRESSQHCIVVLGEDNQDSDLLHLLIQKHLDNSGP
jgi:hypothetical protein